MASTRKSGNTRKAAESGSDDVTVVLAHPLDARHAVRAGLDEQDYAVDDSITVRRETARALIGAGYVQIDPEDRHAVADALKLAPPADVEPGQDAAERPGS